MAENPEKAIIRTASSENTSGKLRVINECNKTTCGYKANN